MTCGKPNDKRWIFDFPHVESHRNVPNNLFSEKKRYKIISLRDSSRYILYDFGDDLYVSDEIQKFQKVTPGKWSWTFLEFLGLCDFGYFVSEIEH